MTDLGIFARYLETHHILQQNSYCDATPHSSESRINVLGFGIPSISSGYAFSTLVKRCNRHFGSAGGYLPFERNPPFTWTQSTDLMLVFPRTRSKYRNQEYTTPIRVRVHDLVSYMIDMHCSNISMLSMCIDIPTHLTHQRWPSTPSDDLESLRTHELKLSRRGRTGNRSAKEMQHLGGVILLIYPPYENCMNTSR